MLNPFYASEKMFDLMSEARTRMNDFSTQFAHSYLDMMSLGVEDIMRSVGLRHILRHKLIGGGLMPFLSNLIDFEKTESEKLVSILKGESKDNLIQYFGKLSEKFLSGMRYDFVVNNLGKQLFGSAKYAGEKRIAENDYYTLTYIPKKGSGPRKGIIFHAGGVLPFSDKLFRFLPEINFFERFIEAGLDVYAMELKGDIVSNPEMKKLTVEKMIDTVHDFTDKAFEHSGKEKMILEGYCGLGMQTAAAVLADVENMKKKIHTLMLMVSPIDGRKCNELGEIMNLFPKSMMFLNLIFTAMRDEVIKGDNLQRTIDVAKKSFFEKTPIGRFFHGWKSGSFANVEKVEDLDPKLRMDIAGTYWISPFNAGLFPVPVSLSHFSTMIFTVGVNKEGVLPVRYKGKQLSFANLKNSGIRFLAFYGDMDAMVPHSTAEFLKDLLGNQVEIIVHEKTGHVSYILSPNRWDESNEKAFKPGIISTMLKGVTPKSTEKGEAKDVKDSGNAGKK